MVKKLGKWLAYICYLVLPLAQSLAAIPPARLNIAWGSLGILVHAVIWKVRWREKTSLPRAAPAPPSVSSSTSSSLPGAVRPGALATLWQFHSSKFKTPNLSGKLPPLICWLLYVWGIQLATFALYADFSVFPRADTPFSNAGGAMGGAQMAHISNKLRRFYHHLSPNARVSSVSMMDSSISQLMIKEWNALMAPANDTQELLAGWSSFRNGVPPENYGTTIVIAALNEHRYIDKTLMGILNTTSATALNEILVIDDANEVPIASAISKPVLDNPLVKILVNKQRFGLIRSKQLGGDLARGSFVVFLDAHVKPEPGWLASLLRDSLANPSRIVLPQIPILKEQTWMPDPLAVGSKMMFNWAMTSSWYNDDLDEVPIMSGGLLGITKQWWNYTHGFDAEMKGWGAENIEQSIRTWLAGGEIAVNHHSSIAHVFRNSFPYALPPGSVSVNKQRTVQLWFDQYKTLSEYGQKELSSVEKASLLVVQELRKTIAPSRNFQWFVERFRDVFIRYQMVSVLTFELQSLNDPAKCLGAVKPDKWHMAELSWAPCETENSTSITRWLLAGSQADESVVSAPTMTLNQQMENEGHRRQQDDVDELYEYWDADVGDYTAEYPPQYSRVGPIGNRHRVTLRSLLTKLCIDAEGSLRKCQRGVRENLYRSPEVFEGYRLTGNVTTELLNVSPDPSQAVPRLESEEVQITRGSLCLLNRVKEKEGANDEEPGKQPAQEGSSNVQSPEIVECALVDSSETLFRIKGLMYFDLKLHPRAANSE